MSAAERMGDAGRLVEAEPEFVPVEIALRDPRSAGDLVTVEGRALPHGRQAPDGGAVARGVEDGWVVDGGPEVEARAGGRIDWLLVWTVLVPVLVAGIYLFVIAADRYRSEAKFIVRSSAGAGLAIDPGGAAMGGASLSRAGEDAFIVDDYITSRDALDRLVREKDLAAVFARPEADRFNRFPPLFGGDSRERLFDYYRSMVKTAVDGSTGISTVEVTAFRPEDALAVDRALLVYAESVVNRINDRANADRVAFARKILDGAKAAVVEAEARLTAFRTASGMIDPAKEYQVALQNISRLGTEASQREAALNQQLALTPNAPGIASQREKVKSYRDEIARQTRAVAGGPDSLAVKLAGFERLSLERDIVAKELVNAEVNLDATQKEAGQQRLYIQTVVAPNLPDTADEPRRMLWFLVVVGTGALAYATLRHLKAIAEEHAR